MNASLDIQDDQLLLFHLSFCRKDLERDQSNVESEEFQHYYYYQVYSAYSKNDKSGIDIDLEKKKSKLVFLQCQGNNILENLVQ